MRRAVITGGRGLIGTHLIPMLRSDGYETVIISRSDDKTGGVESYRWDPATGYCDSNAFRDGDTIIHLAGASIGTRRWSRTRKKEIIDSRVRTAEMIYRASVGDGIKPAAFITASATGIYGSGTTERIHVEEDPPAGDFLSETCRMWEGAADMFTGAGVRVVKIRSAVVLSPGRSALSKLTAPARAGLIIRLGPGTQYFPWIHIDDLCRIYLKAAEDHSMSGPYNASAPDYVTHDMLMHEIAKQHRLPVIIPRVPVWLLGLVLGEMSVALTGGSRISPGRIISTGFSFLYPRLTSALSAC